MLKMSILIFSEITIKTVIAIETVIEGILGTGIGTAIVIGNVIENVTEAVKDGEKKKARQGIKLLEGWYSIYKYYISVLFSISTDF